MFDLIRYLSPVFGVELEVLLQDSFEYLLIIVPFKGRISTQHDKEDHAKTPHITREIVVALEYFWCNIVWCPHNGVHLFGRILLLQLTKTFGETKINELYLCIAALITEEKVFRLQISVANTMLMKMLNGR